MRSHGLNALALDRQHQPRAVATKWLDTISVPKRLSHQRHILLESRRRGFHRSPHNVLEDKRIMPYFLTQWYYWIGGPQPSRLIDDPKYHVRRPPPSCRITPSGEFFSDGVKVLDVTLRIRGDHTLTN